jgi:hypothetical protein
MRHVAPTEKTSSNARCRKHFKATPHRIAGGVELRWHADKPGIELRAGLSAQVGTRGLAHVSPERDWEFVAGGVAFLGLSAVLWYIVLAR